MAPYKVLSYGGGVQSSALLFAACHGDLPNGDKPDIAIFADTRWEPEGVISYVKFATEYAARHDIEVVTVSYASIRSPHGASMMPVFTKDADGVKGMTNRQCTDRYKIQPIRREVRTQLGYKKRQRMKHQIEMWLGISLDEAQRMKPSRETNTTNRWPLIEMEWNREKCKSYTASLGLQVPMKSSCIGCPFHSNRYFLDMKRQRPDEWKDVVAFDKQIRSDPAYLAEAFPNLKGKPYLHRNAEPLEDVYLQEDQIELFGEECSGYCTG